MVILIPALAFVLACLTEETHGSRVSISRERLRNSPVVKRWMPFKIVRNGQQTDLFVHKASMSQLAALLTSFLRFKSPAVGWQPTGSGFWRSPMASSRPATLMSSLEDDTQNAPCPVVDVGVIGAGPAGLTLCHALRDSGYSVRVFERRDSFRPVGAGVFMHPFALNSLRAISPTLEQQLLDVCTQIHTLSFSTLGEGALSFKLDTLDDAPRVLGAPFVTVRFWDMLRSLRSGLPEECFNFGYDLEKFEQHEGNEGGVTLHFANGKPSCSVRYLIDAGGIRSATRQQLIGDERIPRLRATFSMLPGSRVQQAMDSVGGKSARGELAFTAGENLSVVSMGLKDGGVMWSQTDLGADPFKRIAENDDALRQELERYDSKWPANIRAYVKATQLDDVIESTVCELPVSWRWGKDDVTLLGDAAHAQLPALGLGVSTAFGDIEELVKQIRRHGLNRKALRWYEISRMPTCAALQLMSRGMYMLNKVSANAE